MSETPKCPMGHEMELIDVATGGWRYVCKKCATSYKVNKKATAGWLSPIRARKDLAYDAVMRPAATCQQLSQALCGKDCATPKELLEAAEQLKHPKWISVETRLPGCNEFLGISRITGRVQIYWKQGGKHSELTVGGMDIKKELSHWMPMPEKPETE